MSFNAGYPITPELAYNQYVSMQPLTQPHLLNANQLANIQETLSTSWHPDHMLADAWTQIELAQHHDFHGNRPTAQALIATAKERAVAAEHMVERIYPNDPSYLEMLYRAQLIGKYTSHYTQIGPTQWPTTNTKFQQDAYGDIQENILDPLIADYEFWAGETDGKGNDFATIKGALGEIVIMQCLNRLQAGNSQAEWAATPASPREDFRPKGYVDYANNKSQQFDVRVTFANQQFVPVQVKWRNIERARQRYDTSRIAIVTANSPRSYAVSVAKAMRAEVAGDRMSSSARRQVEYRTNVILTAMESATPQGKSIYPDLEDMLPSTGTILSTLRARFNELSNTL